MTNTKFETLDVYEIEAQARALRAQASREMFVAAKAWVARKLSFGTTSAAHNAA
ncbi:hypothetical protein EDD53_0902 [Pacificibacter maritimus]|uniref:Uncharacterized protein n=1 Tax=Pacificibacter maritimus TaxID=762213 RepID=A0A3N4VFQ7_9RHOB|nr:hypothetical protein [Pacificibacter maritimus]RPE71774.1 hypothetical protein EDD53_0902 [Pacificibacter maritimus]